MTIGGASPPLRRTHILKTAALRRSPPLLPTGQGALGQRLRQLYARRLIFPAAGADRHVAESAAGGPVPLAAPTEVSGLINIIIVEVTKFSFHALAPRAWDDLVRPLLSRLIFAFPRFSIMITITIVVGFRSFLYRNRFAEQLDPRFVVSFLDLRHERERVRED